MSDTFNETGYTEQEEDAFMAELKKVGLKPGVNEKQTRFEIVTTVVDLHDSVKEEGCPPHRAFKLAMWKLLEIFERDTGILPIVSANSDAPNGIIGNACEYLLKALAPANMFERTMLGFNIFEVHREWIDKRRRSPHASSTT